MKILEKTARFGVSKWQTIQNTETATEKYITEITLWQNIPLLNFSSSGNAVKILEKTFEEVYFYFIFSCRSAYLLQKELLQRSFELF